MDVPHQLFSIQGNYDFFSCLRFPTITLLVTSDSRNKMSWSLFSYSLRKLRESCANVCVRPFFTKSSDFPGRSGTIRSPIMTMLLNLFFSHVQCSSIFCNHFSITGRKLLRFKPMRNGKASESCSGCFSPREPTKAGFLLKKKSRKKWVITKRSS